MQHFCFLILFLMLAGCVQQTVMPVQPVDAALKFKQTPAELGLNLSIQTFGIDADQHFQQPIQEVESRFLPYQLRQTFADSGYWGAIRVAPALDPSAEVNIQGRVLASDGYVLRLEITVIDSRGDVWLNKVYEDWAFDHQYEIEENSDSFQDLFNLIVNEVNTALIQRSADSGKLISSAMLRYGSTLSPLVFDPYFTRDDNGLMEIVALPASEDAMLKRVLRIRESEYNFMDAMDDHYSLFFKQVKPVYDYWRRYSFELVSYNRTLQQTGVHGRKRPKDRWSSLESVYETYRESKMNEDELREMAQGFESETQSTSVIFEDAVYHMNGSLQSQYGQWRQLLQDLFVAERSVPETQ